MQTFRFFNFPVYKDSKNFYKQIVSATKNFPRDNEELKKQSIRAALSISLNIAEGSAKKSDKDFNRYVENSLGSVNECVSALDIAFDNQLINSNSFEAMVQIAEKIAKQLGGLSKKLKNS